MHPRDYEPSPNGRGFDPTQEYAWITDRVIDRGCLLDSALPPEVPPRNPAMNRHNGRSATGVGIGNTADGDFEPSCLVRTPSGNVYIPTDVPKSSPMDYKSNSSCSSPSKGENQKNSDRCSLPFGTPVPVLPVRNNLRRPNSSHFPPSRFQFRKGIARKCTWKCTAIVFIILSVVLTAALVYMSATNLLTWSYQSAKACTVLVGESTSIFPKVSEANRTSVRPRPSSGGKYLRGLPPHPSNTVEIPPTVVLPRTRIRRDANQHDPPRTQDALSVDVGVVHDDENDDLVHATEISETLEEPSTISVDGLLKEDELVPVDLSSSLEEMDSSEANNDNSGMAGSGGDSEETTTSDSFSEKAQEDSTDKYVEEDELPQKDNDGEVYVTLRPSLGGGEMQNTSPDANKLNNEIKEHLLRSANTDTDVQIESLTEVEEEEISTTIHPEDATVIDLKDSNETKNDDSSKEADKMSRIDSPPPLETHLRPHSEPLVHVVDANTQHETTLTKDTPNKHLHSHKPNYPNIGVTFNGSASPLTKLPKTDLLDLTTELNGSRHSKRVFVNVTIATEDDNVDVLPGHHHPSQPVYVLSVSVPTDGESNGAEIDISPPAQNVASILLGLSENASQDIVADVNKETQLTSSSPDPVRPLWGGECECSCPCLNDSNDEDTDSNLNANGTLLPGNVTEGGQGVWQEPTSKYDDSSGGIEDHNELLESSIEPSIGKTADPLYEEVTSENPSTTLTSEGIEGLSSLTTPSALTGDDEVSLEGSPVDVEQSFTTEEDYETKSTETTASTKEGCEAVPAATYEPPLPPPILILEGAKTFPARTFPPDGTTFSQISLGQKLSKEVPPYGYWNMQFYQSEAAYVKFDYNIPRGASIGVYARRNALPTHTQYDLLEVLSGFKARNKRGSSPNVKKEVTHYMEQGHWFLSLYNDDGDPQDVTFVAMIAEDMTENCPNGCNGNGECLLGHCQCNPGFGGEDCSESVCPVLCSQRGEYINGECQCNPGWKGKECSLRHDECEAPDCNGHGHCTNGKCACVRGYKGKFCEEADCPHPNCSGHGFCVEGTCICKKGWKGVDCSQTDNDALQCLPDCSGHGKFDLDTQSCLCEPMWSGDDCSRELCDLDCGPHGHCVGDACMCQNGWSGEYCNMKQCDPRCNDHGQCKNGTCLCVAGWNGRHCTLEGCPDGCNGHGQCRFGYDGAWECRCYDGWDGTACNIPLEQSCSDGRDNDKDGLVDCEDPECCSNHLCRSSQLCVSAPKPIDILLRKQPPAITASFFERMKFLIEEGSLQNYAKQESFNESRTAVVRGRVVTPTRMGLMGVRVSTSTPLEGFTLTRDDGWFDLLVNGGGAVTLQFGRSPFRPQSQIVNVPWNEVVIIDTIFMVTGDEKPQPPVAQACESHDYDLMMPVVLATWKHGFQGACPDKSAILAESQVVQESLQIPGTGLHLVYHSSRATGYLSTIQLQLTPDTIPTTLKLVHLRITIEGILFEKTFEADPDIKFTYAWNRLNVYRQRVYGVTTAMVKVGYEYNDCKDIIWDVQTTKLSGHDMSISEVGGWNLDIHHRYNFHEGILQKGDGSNIYLKHKPRVILTAMGNGHQRPLDCYDCDGQASKQRLLAPVALTASADGSIFVGDFNLVRRILTDGTVRTVVRLNATRVSYRYHLALSPLDGILYISDPESHQIIRVRNIDDYSDPDHNWEPAVGSGERCLPGDEAHCGDGALARDAKLAYPKGVAVSSDNVVYFADGTNIRMVDRDGIVTTVIGNHMHKAHWKPIPCEGTLNVEEVHLRWPTELAINPLDNTLQIIDDHMILQLTPDGRVKVVAGRPLHCPSPAGSYGTELATHATLVMPQSIAFGPNGDLYVAESDSQRINRVRVIGTDGKIFHYAGAESKCNCLDRGCDCFDEDHFLAATSKFNTISSIAVTPDGILHIGDQANYRIRSVVSSIPESNQAREYEIFSPETQEIYVFNRFGQHIATKNILTGETSYLFTYNVNTSNGKLSTVTDAAGNKVFLLRDYSSQVNSIENTKGQKCRLRMSRMRMLHELSTPDNYNVTFDYHGSTGLLKTKLDSTGRSYVYNYDEFGRLTRAITPTGQVINLSFDLSIKGATVKVAYGDQKPVAMLIKGSTVITKNGNAEHATTIMPDGSTVSTTPWMHSISTDTVAYTVLSDLDPVLGESFPVPAKQKTEIGGDLANRFEWRYFLRREGKGKKNKQVVQIGRKLRVNGENLLTLEYDRETGTVAVFMDDRVELLNVTYDRLARPVKLGPRNEIFAPVELAYDRFSRLTNWKWGDITETYGFDRAGRLYEIRYGDGTAMTYAFKDMFSSLPLKVTTPRGSDYFLMYDDAGALQSLTTPRGHIHAFSLQTSLGFFKYQYFSPMNRHPYEILYNDESQIIAKVYPHQSGKVAYVYGQNRKLETILYGLSSIHYAYHENTGLVRNVDVVEPNFEMKKEFKYHAGILKEERFKFGSKSGLDNAHFKYQYDGNARISGIDLEVNGKELKPIRMKYNQNLGMLESVSDLRIYRNTFNRSVMQDTSKQFFTITDYDKHGRIKSVMVNIKAFDVYRLELEYDKRNRIKSQKIMIGRSSTSDRFTYNADGHLLEVIGSGNWKYVYDENGNVIGVIEHGEKITLGYDSGDRVVQYGDVEFNGYDGRGFVVRRGEQKYYYNALAQLSHAFEKEKFQVWYFYDDRGRLVSWHDDQGNVTQYFYGNPAIPDLVSHMHFPKTGKTSRLLYDERKMLVSIETAESRFYVATDQNGSPLAVFDMSGNIVKEIHRTPFGKVVKDTNPGFYLPVDFQGGLLDIHTGLVFINQRLYDPVVGQWITPAWEEMANKLTTPTDVFIYRFHNNDPINPLNKVNYMTDIHSWLKLYGYNVETMLGSKYTSQTVYHPSADIKSPQLSPEFGVISGLQCIIEKINEKFRDLGFVPKPLLKLEPKTRNLLPKVAYRRAVFGEGVLISRVAGRAMVSVVDGVNGVVQDVVTSVFNNSFFLDVHLNVHDQDVFYFVKDNILKMRDDQEELRRLGGMFNVSAHEVETGGARSVAAGNELRLHGPDAVVYVRYGTDAEAERRRVLKHAHKRAVERAWEAERQLVGTGFPGSHTEWTEEERRELLARGDVEGYEGLDAHGVHRYPMLADDPGNISFGKRDGGGRRRRRKSRRSRPHPGESSLS